MQPTLLLHFIMICASFSLLWLTIFHTPQKLTQSTSYTSSTKDKDSSNKNKDGTRKVNKHKIPPHLIITFRDYLQQQ